MDLKTIAALGLLYGEIVVIGLSPAWIPEVIDKHKKKKKLEAEKREEFNNDIRKRAIKVNYEVVA